MTTAPIAVRGTYQQQASPLCERIAQVALEQFRRWRPRGGAAHMETSPAASPILREYYRDGVETAVTDADMQSTVFQDAHPWSAVFVSYVMRTAGAGAAFAYSAAPTQASRTCSGAVADTAPARSRSIARCARTSSEERPVMNNKFRFEIVRRGNGRFGWVFVRVKGGRRVLARSVRDYGSPEKVDDAINRMRAAQVDDTTAGSDLFPLPATSFRIVSGVVPLVVEDVPADFDPSDLEPRVILAPQPAAIPVAPKRKPASKPKAGRKQLPVRTSKPRRSARRSAV